MPLKLLGMNRVHLVAVKVNLQNSEPISLDSLPSTKLGSRKPKRNETTESVFCFTQCTERSNFSQFGFKGMSKR